MKIGKIKQDLLNLLEKETTRRGDKQVILAIIHALDFIDDFVTNEMTVRELRNKYSEFGG